jgi:hypothetical protein
VQVFVPARGRSVRDIALTLSRQRYANTKRVIVYSAPKIAPRPKSFRACCAYIQQGCLFFEDSGGVSEFRETHARNPSL